MEQTKEINGLTVYLGGTWFEISLPHCGGVMYSGTCSPNTDLQRIYDYCFPLSPRNGRLYDSVTLFFDGGSEIYSIHAEYALLNFENCSRPQDGYCLWYSPPRSRVFSTVTFIWKDHIRPRRPRIIVVERYMTMPAQLSVDILKKEAQQGQNMDAERPVNPSLMDSITSHLDRSGITWTEM